MKDCIKESEAVLIPFYNKFPICITRGKNHWVWDQNGRKYLDLTSGIGVVNFGHANPRVAGAVSAQMRKITHISNLFYNPLQAEFCGRILRMAFPGKLFFCNSGAEANETALKMARMIGNAKSPLKNKVLALNGSFHGRTVATISLTGQNKYKKGFEPLLKNIDFVEANDIKGLKKKFSKSVCAIFLEAVQGESGVIRLTEEFLAEVEKLAAKFDTLIVFDEVQAGLGRTGKYFAYQHFNIRPHMITMAKALGNGFPIGAVLAVNEVADQMPGGMHASTFGGNYVACAAGIASLDQLDDKMLARVNRVSQYFQKKLEDLKSIFPKIIKENRVYGLMIGVELDEKYQVKDIINRLIAKNILTLRAGENVLRLLPPFTLGEKDIDMFCKKLFEVFGELA